MPQQPEKRWIGYPLGDTEQQVSYRIYPSLLDKYQQMLGYEEEADAPWNIVSEKAVEENRYPGKEVGDYILTPEEIYDKLEQELIDTINREPREPSEAADKGTALNEIIDCLLTNSPCKRDDMTIQSQRVGNEPISIRCDYDGFTFDFDIGLCNSLKQMLKGSMCQVLIQAPINTSYGLVMLYGYMDYWNGPEIIDLKSTSKYEFGKYARYWQRHTYPWCAIESGLTDRVDKFTFLAAQLGKGKIIKGSIYPEVYTYDHESSGNLLKAHIESFIGWLESHRDKIVNTKIFNQ